MPARSTSKASLHYRHSLHVMHVQAEQVRRMGCLEMALVNGSLAQGIKAEYLAGPTRGRAPLSAARQRVQYLAHVGFGLTYTEIAGRFNRDRTSVAHACRCVEDSRESHHNDYALTHLEVAMRAMAQSVGLLDKQS